MINDIDTRCRQIAEVGRSNAPYYRFIIGLVKGRGQQQDHKVWLLHHGFIETWDLVDYD